MLTAAMTNLTTTALRTNETVINVLEDAFRKTIEELIQLSPKIVLSILLVALIAVLGMIVIEIVKRILLATKVDEFVKPLSERYGIPISVTSLATVLLKVGFALLALYIITIGVFPEYRSYVTAVLDIVSRVVSVAITIFIVVTMLTLAVEKMRMERGLRGFMLLLSLLISLALLIDLMNLSPELKHSLSWGLSLGIGLSIGVFTAWYFFGSQIPRRESKESQRS